MLCAESSKVVLHFLFCAHCQVSAINRRFEFNSCHQSDQLPIAGRFTKFTYFPAGYGKRKMADDCNSECLFCLQKSKFAALE